MSSFDQNCSGRIASRLHPTVYTVDDTRNSADSACSHRCREQIYSGVAAVWQLLSILTRCYSADGIKLNEPCLKTTYAQSRAQGASTERDVWKESKRRKKYYGWPKYVARSWRVLDACPSTDESTTAVWLVGWQIDLEYLSGTVRLLRRVIVLSLDHIARRDSTQHNCFVELSRVGRCDHFKDSTQQNWTQSGSSEHFC